MIQSIFLRELSANRRATPGKTYIDHDGKNYIGNDRGKLILVETPITFTKEETIQQIQSVVSSSSGVAVEVDPIWNAEKDDYSLKIFTIAMSIALG